MLVLLVTIKLFNKKSTPHRLSRYGGGSCWIGGELFPRREDIILAPDKLGSKVRTVFVHRRFQVGFVDVIIALHAKEFWAISENVAEAGVPKAGLDSESFVLENMRWR